MAVARPVQGDEMAAEVEPFCQQGLVNALGGCCGSRPEHIAAIVKMASEYPPRAKHEVGARWSLRRLI